jgi:hypothetical protein
MEFTVIAYSVAHAITTIFFVLWLYRIERNIDRSENIIYEHMAKTIVRLYAIETELGLKAPDVESIDSYLARQKRKQTRKDK